MHVTLVTAPACDPVTVAELKEHLRLLSPAQDSLLSGLITAARQRAESYLRRAIINATFDATFSRWPNCWPASHRSARQFAGRVLPLPRGNVRSVTSVKYLDEAGAEQTFASSNYTVDTYTLPGRIVLNPTASWPALGDFPSAIRIRFVAGYAPAGTTAAADLRAAVPESVKLAVKFLAAHYFANPQPVVTGTIATQLPEHVHALLNDERIHGFGYPDEEAAA